MALNLQSPTRAKLLPDGGSHVGMGRVPPTGRRRPGRRRHSQLIQDL